MNTLKEKLDYLGETKYLIRDSIRRKGGTINDDKFRSYAQAIESIPTTGAMPNTLDYMPVSGVISQENLTINLKGDMNSVTSIKGFLWHLPFNETTIPSMPNLINANSAVSDTLITTFEVPELPKIENTSGMLANNINLTKVTFRDTVFNATDIRGMFAYNRMLKEVTLPQLPNVTQMGDLFVGCSELTGDFDFTSAVNVEEMNSAFSGCCKINSLRFGDLSKVKDMSYTFAMGVRYPQLTPAAITELYVDKLPCIILNNWGLEGCPNLSQESLTRIANALPNANHETSADQIRFSSESVAKLTPEARKTIEDKGWHMV